MIITKPKNGWAKLIIEEPVRFEGNLSYIQDIPGDFLKAFRSYLERDVAVAIECDEEGSDFIIVLTQYEVRIIIDREELTAINPEISSVKFISYCCAEFEKNISEWAGFSCFDGEQNKIEENKIKLKKEIEYICGLLRKSHAQV